LILAPGWDKIGAPAVPIDRPTSSRELELVMDTVPLRALITRPRGTDGRDALPETRKPASRSDVPESRRRLQSTLLTCSMYRRPPPSLDVRPEVVMFTADSAGDPKAVLRTRQNLEA